MPPENKDPRTPWLIALKLLYLEADKETSSGSGREGPSIDTGATTPTPTALALGTAPAPPSPSPGPSRRWYHRAAKPIWSHRTPRPGAPLSPKRHLMLSTRFRVFQLLYS